MLSRTSLESSRFARLCYLAAPLLLLILAVELLFSVRQQSRTVDEAAHLYAGYQHWTAHDYGVNPEHPPLVKLVAALPLLGRHIQQPHPPNPFFYAEEYIGGDQLLGLNGGDDLLQRARTALVVFPLLLGAMIFLAGTEMFGPVAGLLALTILCFEPTPLAHGVLITTDMGVAVMVFATVWTFWRHLQRPGWDRLLLFALAFGLALVTKMSGAIALPILLVLGAMEMMQRDHRRPLQVFGGIAVAALARYGILWAFYGFRYAARPRSDITLMPPLAAFAMQLPSHVERALVLFAAKFHLLPEAYLYGWTKLPIDQMAHPAFLFGKVYPTGVPWYFPAALLIKTSIPLLLLTGASLVMVFRREFRYRRQFLFVLVPMLMIVLASMISKLDIGVRHVLPVYPFAVLLAGATAWLIGQRSRPAAIAIALVMLFQVGSSLHAYPDYLPYANEAFGGSNRTYRLLSDSNVDWGQQRKEEHAYLERHHITDCWTAYPQVMPQPLGYGIPCKLLPSGLGVWAGSPQTIMPLRVTGVFLLGTFETSGAVWGPGDMNPYRQFQDGRPKDVIGHSILVYEGTYDVPLLAAQSHMSQATGLIRAGQVDRAIQEANNAVAIAPEAADVQVELGAMFLSLQRKAEAEAAFSRALALAKAHRPDDQTETIAQRIDVLRKGTVLTGRRRP